MTDNEIIKALERMSAEDADSFSSDILDLIKRQQAEIERLTGYNSNLVFANQEVLYTLETEIAKAKAEAITEFAERLKDYLNSDRFYDRVLKCLFDDIDNLVKEMTEANDE